MDLSLEEGGVYRVKEVVDGDTITLENGLHVRYQGVNTPEAGRWVVDPAPMSEAAKARNRELVEGKPVRLRFGHEPLDKYGRVLARVETLSEQGEPVDVEAVLIREGLGKVFTLDMPAEEQQRLKALQGQAQESRLGIWGVTKPAAEEGQAPFPFCSASGGQVFHRAECAQAKRITAANFHGYRTLEDARASGRRPCSQCLKDEKP